VRRKRALSKLRGEPVSDERSVEVPDLVADMVALGEEKDPILWSTSQFIDTSAPFDWGDVVACRASVPLLFSTLPEVELLANLGRSHHPNLSSVRP
jgi:hypothetical protein